jgi:hypothetical protein
MSKHSDLTGRRFGCLTVLSFARYNSTRNAYWLCQCDCGRQHTVRGQHLLTKATATCGMSSLDAHREIKRLRAEIAKLRKGA